MQLSDIPTDETVGFITSHLPPATRMLEVGAGRGQVARRLRALKYSLVAMDSDAQAVASAKRDEIEIVRTEFLSFHGDRFDAIVFTRSLHHLNPLAAAIEHARSLVRREGIILIEDFAFEKMTQATAGWLYEELRTLETVGVLNRDAKGFGAEFLKLGGDLAAWKTLHDGQHQIHTASEIETALGRVFQITGRSTAPYLYRYITPMLRDDSNGCRILKAMLLRERAMIERGSIEPIGRRLVAVGFQRD